MVDNFQVQLQGTAYLHDCKKSLNVPEMPASRIKFHHATPFPAKTADELPTRRLPMCVNGRSRP
jgi:hypothetical protein